MNHGGLGFIDEDGSIAIDHDILNTLCLGLNSQLYGMYYPCTPQKLNREYKNISLKHDLMLTPIPPRYWPVSARIHIYLKQRPGTQNKICRYLADHKISIIHGESTRSAFRYATWSLHIAFEELLDGRELNYNPNKNYYSETHTLLTALIEDMNVKFGLGDLLFAPDYLKTVDGTVNCPLAYFTNFYSNNSVSNWVKERSLLKPFQLTLTGGARPLLTGGSDYRCIVGQLKARNRNLFPSVIFYELDIRALNIRLVLIPEKDGERFFLMGLEYKRSSIERSAGILYQVTKNLPRQYNIWQSYNYTVISKPEYEEGNFVFIIEDLALLGKPSHLFAREQYYDEMRDKLKSAFGRGKGKHIEFGDLDIIALPTPPILNQLFRDSHESRQYGAYKYDVFISYSHDDEQFVETKIILVFEKYKLSYFKDRKFLEFGTTLDDALLLSIRNCREMCIIVSQAAAASEWVARERGAFWILGKTLVPITIMETLPSSFQHLVYVNGLDDKDINKYVKEVYDRRIKAEANRFRHHYGK